MAGLCMLCGVLLACAAADDGKTVTILFSGSANGVLRSCHCPSSPWGGLAKRAWVVEQIRTAAGRDRVLTLDSGDLFPPEPSAEHAKLLLKVFGRIQYQAVAIGDQEISSGLDFWIAANRQAGVWDAAKGRSSFPWLSGGYRLTSGTRQGQMLVTPWQVLRVGDVNVGIVSVTGGDAWRFARTKPDGVTLTDADRTIAVFLENIREPLDLVIVLSHQGEDSDRALAARMTGVDLIIGGHSQSLISPPEVVNGVAICQAGKNGENLGVLALARYTVAEKNSGAPDGQSSVPNEDGGTNENPFEATFVQGRRWRIAQQIVPLTTDVGDSPEVARLIDAYYREQDSENAKRLSVPGPQAKTEVPQLVLTIPSEPVVLNAGDTQTVEVVIGNRGGTPLVVERIRSKSPWMKVVDTPDRIEPGEKVAARFEVVAKKIDRFFRCDFSVIANDPTRRVVVAGFPGRVEGPMPGLIDVPGLWSNLYVTAMGPANRNVLSGLEPATEDSRKEQGHRVLVEYFYSPGCPDCRELEKTFLPNFTNRFADLVEFRKVDVTVPSNYLHLARMQERLRVRSNEPVSMYVDGSTAVLGLDAIRTDLIRIVTTRTGAGQEDDVTGGAASDGPPVTNVLSQVASQKTAQATAERSPGARSASVPNVLSSRLQTFALPAILIAGLVDGVNPCAFATIIFFITLLTVAGVKGPRILLVGAAYSMAVFCTYLLLGFGALRILQLLANAARLGSVLRWGVVGVLLILALVSFRDALVFSRSGRASDVALQLPDRLKRKIHEIMRTRLRPSSLFFSTLAIGFLVTILEAACTGQVYVPTLVVLSRYAETRSRSLLLLVAYNLMFVLPLVVVTVATYLGTRNQRLLNWSRGNVVWGKLTMGVLFAILAWLTFAVAP